MNSRSQGRPPARSSLTGRGLLQGVLLALVAFLLLSYAIYALAQQALKHSQFRMSRIAQGGVHVDILVAGNSRARDLIAARPPGVKPTAFNLAYNGLGREDTFAWVRIFFERGNTAGTVVIESSALYSDEQLCAGKAFWPLYPELRRAQAAGCPLDARLARWLPLTMLDSEQFLRALYYVGNGRDDQDWGGEYSLPRERCDHVDLSDIFAFRQTARRMDPMQVRSQIEALREWLTVHAPGTRLVFVLAPFLAAPEATAAIAELERIDDSLLGRRDNVSLATLLGRQCDEFADSEHVSALGRARLSEALFSALSQGNADMSPVPAPASQR